MLITDEFINHFVIIIFSKFQIIFLMGWRRGPHEESSSRISRLAYDFPEGTRLTLRANNGDYAIDCGSHPSISNGTYLGRLGLYGHAYAQPGHSQLLLPFLDIQNTFKLEGAYPATNDL